MKRKLSLIFTILTVLSLLCACGPTTAETQGTDAQQTDTAAGSAAAELVADIPTTQYFSDDPVADEDIEKILYAGINAPSAMNGQPWHYTAITDSNVLEEIASGMSMPVGAPPVGGEGMLEGVEPPDDSAAVPPEIAEAGGTGVSSMSSSAAAKAGMGDTPLAIVISCEEGSELDAGLACQAMSIEAQLLGYGTKILTSPTMVLGSDEYSELLSIPVGQRAVAVLLVGVVDTTVDTTADGYTGATERNPFDEVVTYVSAEEG